MLYLNFPVGLLGLERQKLILDRESAHHGVSTRTEGKRLFFVHASMVE
jgi:hypothetical protein